MFDTTLLLTLFLPFSTSDYLIRQPHVTSHIDIAYLMAPSAIHTSRNGNA